MKLILQTKLFNITSKTTQNNIITPSLLFKTYNLTPSFSALLY